MNVPAEKYQFLYEYLALRNDSFEKSDLIIGFGHFDLRIAQRCGELFLRGAAPKILFTGGVGAGSAGFNRPEAVEFRDSLLKAYPDIDSGDLILESDSTNTAQNVEFSLKILKSSFGIDPAKPGSRIVAVATPARQRRVYLTLKKYFPGTIIFNMPPVSDFWLDQQLFQDHQERLETTVLGEMQRLVEYPAKGWIAEVAVPPRALEIYHDLQNVS